MFRTVYLDPPWPERGGGKCKRGADRHYPLINTRGEMLDTIERATLWTLEPDAHMYMWSTDNYLHWAMELIPALGFKMHRTIPWVKPGCCGLGQYFRGAHELLLFATRGKGFNVRTGTKKMRTDQLVGVPGPVDERGKRIHSAKPMEAYSLIEERSKGPYLEMFARSHREGWSSWGNEVNGCQT